MEDLERRLLRLFILIVGVYVSIKSVEKDISDNNLILIVMLIGTIYTLIDTFIPRVHIKNMQD
jgi:hypothetical protein